MHAHYSIISTHENKIGRSTEHDIFQLATTRLKQNRTFLEGDVQKNVEGKGNVKLEKRSNGNTLILCLKMKLKASNFILTIHLNFFRQERHVNSLVRG